MKAVTIHDGLPQGVLAVDLIDLLRLFEAEVHSLSWTISNVWCLGDRAEEFMRASEANETMAGMVLTQYASGVYQVIDGLFIGREHDASQPSLVIEAVDSTYYVVASNSPGLIDRVSQRYSDVRPSPEWVEGFAGFL